MLEYFKQEGSNLEINNLPKECSTDEFREKLQDVCNKWLYEVASTQNISEINKDIDELVKTHLLPIERDRKISDLLNDKIYRK